MKLLLPIINIAIAIALFFGVTDPAINGPLEKSRDKDQNPVYEGGVKVLRAEAAKLDRAMETAQELKEKVTALTADFNNFSEEDRTRLDKLLPDHVDNIQLIIDINNIAARNGMLIKNIKIKTAGEAKPNDRSTAQAPTPVPVGGAAVLPPGSVNSLDSVTLSFSVTSSYNAYQKFLIDLSKSLRLTDISTTSFESNDKNVYTYNVEIKTYWLR